MTLILPRVVGVFSRKLWPLLKPALYPTDLNLLRKISDTQQGFEDAFKAAERAAAALKITLKPLIGDLMLSLFR